MASTCFCPIHSQPIPKGFHPQQSGFHLPTSSLHLTKASGDFSALILTNRQRLTQTAPSFLKHRLGVHLVFLSFCLHPLLGRSSIYMLGTHEFLSLALSLLSLKPTVNPQSSQSNRHLKAFVFKTSVNQNSCPQIPNISLHPCCIDGR